MDVGNIIHVYKIMGLSRPFPVQKFSFSDVAPSIHKEMTDLLRALNTGLSLASQRLADILLLLKSLTVYHQFDSHDFSITDFLIIKSNDNANIEDVRLRERERQSFYLQCSLFLSLTLTISRGRLLGFT